MKIFLCVCEICCTREKGPKLCKLAALIYHVCLLLQVAKQWYDYERTAYHFVRVARELTAPILCKRVSDFDQNGIFYWIGSNAR